jgi:hypothetical protein
MVPHSEDKDWISIAEQASKEMNPRKLMTLVKQLCSALDNSEKGPVGEKSNCGGIPHPTL